MVRGGRGPYAIRRVIISAAVGSLALLLHFVVEAAWFSEDVCLGRLRAVDILLGRVSWHGTALGFWWYEANMSPWHTGWVLGLSALITYQVVTTKRLRLASSMLGWLLTFILSGLLLIYVIAPWTTSLSSLCSPVSLVSVTAVLVVGTLAMWQLGRVLGSTAVCSLKRVWIWPALWLLSAGLVSWLPLAPERQIFVNPLGVVASSMFGLVSGIIVGWGEDGAQRGASGVRGQG